MEDTIELQTEQGMLSVEDIYWDAMDKFLELRGELELSDKGFKGNIITKSSILKQCYYPLRQCGFRLPSVSKRSVDGLEYLTTVLRHKDGFCQSRTDIINKWVVHPEGYDKQYNAAFHYQSAQTYIEGKHLVSLLYIYDGFNPEEQSYETDIKSGAIETISAVQEGAIRKAINKDKDLWNLIQDGFQVKSINKLEAKDFDNIISYIELHKERGLNA